MNSRNTSSEDLSTNNWHLDDSSAPKPLDPTTHNMDQRLPVANFFLGDTSTPANILPSLKSSTAETTPYVSKEHDDPDDLAQELNQLSISERQCVLYDLHGIDNEQRIHETPELIASTLFELETLFQTERHKGDLGILQLVESHAPARLHDRKFRLLFLRAELFVVKEAFHRMLQYFELTLQLFGELQLDRKLTVDDLKPEDREYLKTGWLQVSPFKDRAGRQIIFCSTEHGDFANHPVDSTIRCAFFILMSSLEDDEDFQRNGGVVIMSYYGAQRRFYPALAWRAVKLHHALPMRIPATHALVKEQGFGHFVKFRKLWQRHRRMRSRVHYGTVMEVLYALMTFGVPSESVPLNLDGSIKLEAHLEWLKRHDPSGIHFSSLHKKISDNTEGATTGNTPPVGMQTSSRQASPFPGELIPTPSRNDVLFGRGRPIQEHHGNIVFNNLLEAVRDQYDGLRRAEKTSMTYTIVAKIKRAGGRFLRPYPGNPDLWEEVDDSLARTKVSHTFRSLRQHHRGGDVTGSTIQNSSSSPAS
eukprot:Nitzschia sp. Nitz4//scaffold49_size126201//114290//115996//NITZ4_003661-RA/size126201-snap-gene-0.54-mRNA-1//1//CDS//3329553206//3164//frame0